MSMFSAFGFSGYDPIGSLMENQDNTLWGQMNNTFNGMRDWYYAKKASARQAALQWEYQKRAALEMPTLQKQGLIAAGFNPLLAISKGIASPSSMPVSTSSPISGGHVPSAPNGSAGFDAQQFFSALNARKLTDATVKSAEVDSAVKASQVALNAQRILESKASAFESASRVERNARDSRYPGPLGQLARTLQSAFEDGRKGFKILNQQAADALSDAIHSAKDAISARIQYSKKHDVHANENAKAHREKGLRNSSIMERKYDPAPLRSINDRR